MGQSEAYLQPGKRDVEEEERKGNGEPQKGHEKEGDGSEASSTILGYSLPVSWGPCCTSTILFLFLFFNVLVPVRTFLSFYLSTLPLSFLVPFTVFLSFYRTPVVHLFRYADIPFLVPFFIGFLLCRAATFATLFLLFGILRSVPATLQSRSVRVPFSFTLRSDHVQDQISPNRDPRDREVSCSNCTQYGLLQVRQLSHFFFFLMKIICHSSKRLLDTIENFNIGRFYF